MFAQLWELCIVVRQVIFTNFNTRFRAVFESGIKFVSFSGHLWNLIYLTTKESEKMKKLFIVLTAVSMTAFSCSKVHVDLGYQENYVVDNVEEAQDILNDKLNNQDGNGSPVSIEIKEVGANDEIIIPAGLTETNTPEITIDLKSTFTGKFLVLDQNQTRHYDGMVNITAPAANNGELEIDLPSADVHIHGKYSEVDAIVSSNSLFVESDCTIGMLHLQQGNAVIFGTVNDFEIHPGATYMPKIGTGLPYTTISEALADDQAKGVVLAAGTHSETDVIVIDRPFTIYGPNYGVNPNNADWTPATRTPEAIVKCQFRISRQGDDNGEIIVDGVEFTGLAWINMMDGGYQNSMVNNCIIHDTDDTNDNINSGFIYINRGTGGTPAFTFNNNRVSNVNSQNPLGSSGVLFWGVDKLTANGNFFTRTNSTSGMSSNAAIQIGPDTDGPLTSVIIQNNRIEDMCVKIDATNYPLDQIKGNVFTGRVGAACFALFNREWTAAEDAQIKAANTIPADSKVSERQG